MARHLNTGRWPRLLIVAALGVGVVGVHLGVVDVLAARVAAWGAPGPEIERVQVAYVREMAFSAPRVAPAAPALSVPPAPRGTLTARPVAAASALAAPPPTSAVDMSPPRPVESPASEPAAAPAEALSGAPSEPPVSAPDAAVASSAVLPPAPPMVSTAPATSEAPAAAAEAASSPFEWPVSTRLRYTLTGQVRGEVHGQAQVEWVRAGSRYQVHLDVEVGPSFAPVARRRLSSDGEISADGLVPHLYEQETRVAWGTPWRAAVKFEAGRVWLSNGRSVPWVAGVQDTASQFVQLAYLFDQRPDRLQVGAQVALLLAMPRQVSPWVYDVVGEERLTTPFGEVPTFHLRPRREALAGGDLVPELWLAPQLRHLPVRFRIRQDADTYLDLMLDRRPQLAAPETPPARTPP